MYRHAIILACAGGLALAGCETLTNDEKIAVGGLAGAAAGLITANALNANTEWTIIAALAGAAAGTLVARNQITQKCAYSNGDGTYTIAACP